MAATGLLAPFLAGSAIILPAGGRFSAGTFWRDAIEFGATFYTAVPTMHQVPISDYLMHLLKIPVTPMIFAPLSEGLGAPAGGGQYKY